MKIKTLKSETVNANQESPKVSPAEIQQKEMLITSKRTRYHNLTISEALLTCFTGHQFMHEQFDVLCQSTI